jgi:hypothetical protein
MALIALTEPVPDDEELHYSHCADNASHCILTSITSRLVYAPSERPMCYTLRKGYSYAVAVNLSPVDVYAFLHPRDTFYLSAIPINAMPHMSITCFSSIIVHIVRYILRFIFIACQCICCASIVFYRSAIYCPIFSLSSTMPSHLHILC